MGLNWVERIYFEWVAVAAFRENKHARMTYIF
jgi:hypothetical protein